MDQSDIDQASPPHSERHPHSVYTYFGFAAYWAQLFELMMLDLVAIIRLADGEQIDNAAYAAAFDGLDRHTLGMLLQKCRAARVITIPQHYEAVLHEGVAKRNYLMHRFFSIHDAELLDDSEPLVDELRILAASFAAARQTAESLYRNIVDSLDSDGKMTERIFWLGTAWQNVVTK